MMFNKGKGRFSDPKHIRRARAYLEEARMAMLEHSIAAEHYQAASQGDPTQCDPAQICSYL